MRLSRLRVTPAGMTRFAATGLLLPTATLVTGASFESGFVNTAG
eukprot:gene9275-biopygen7643